LIGRTDLASGIHPDIDISPFGGGQQISRRHAETTRRNGTFFLRDLGSHLGTLVNGEPLGASEIELTEGDAITFGDITLRFSLACSWPEGLTAEGDGDGASISTETQPAMELPLMVQLSDALRNGQLFLHYQPLVALNTGEIPTVEALMRWNHPDTGMIEPDRYVPLTEDTGFVRVLTSFAISEAAAALTGWRSEGVAADVAINLSISDLEDPSLADRLMEAVDAAATKPRDFILEVTERGVMSNPGVAIATLMNLRLLGFRITIDDYGTGQSSLAYLKDLPAHEIKLDKSFVNGTTSRDEAIIGSTVELAHELGMTVVAEGVESEATATLVHRLDCDKAQGFLFGKPSSKDELDLSPRSLPWSQAGTAT
jgi:EAL domain-containing protein (putative c-di-GMP-specific phosphodiesterase class I)